MFKFELATFFKYFITVGYCYFISNLDWIVYLVMDHYLEYLSYNSVEVLAEDLIMSGHG